MRPHTGDLARRPGGLLASLGVGLLLGLSISPLRPAATAPGQPAAALPPGQRFELSRATLRDGALAAARLLGVKIVIQLDPSHPAFRTPVSLSMPVKEANDLLNALA